MVWGRGYLPGRQVVQCVWATIPPTTSHAKLAGGLPVAADAVTGTNGTLVPLSNYRNQKSQSKGTAKLKNRPRETWVVRSQACVLSLRPRWPADVCVHLHGPGAGPHDCCTHDAQRGMT